MPEKCGMEWAWHLGSRRRRLEELAASRAAQPPALRLRAARLTNDCRHVLAHVSPGQDPDAYLAHTVVVVVLIAEHLDFRSKSKCHVLIDDERRRRPRTGDRQDGAGTLGARLRSVSKA